MNDESAISDQWGACPPGELQKLQRRIRWRRRDRHVAKAVGMTGVLVAVLCVGGLSLQQFRGHDDGAPLYGDISCAEVQAQLPQFVAGGLDPQSAERTRIHLDQCPECGPAFRRMMAETKHAVSYSPRPRSVPGCMCGHCKQPTPATGPHFPIKGPDAVAVAMHVLR